MSKIIIDPFIIRLHTVADYSNVDTQDNRYPPHNIESVGDNSFFIKLAIAGFAESDIEIMQCNNEIIISGKKDEHHNTGVNYIHKGISTRKFKKKFKLSEEIEPVYSFIENGILVIELKRKEPQYNVRKILIEKKDKLQKEKPEN